MGTFATIPRKSGRKVHDAVLDTVTGNPVIVNGILQTEDRDELVYDLVYYTPSDSTDLRIPVKTIFTENERDILVRNGHNWVAMI